MAKKGPSFCGGTVGGADGGLAAFPPCEFEAFRAAIPEEEGAGATALGNGRGAGFATGAVTDSEGGREGRESAAAGSLTFFLSRFITQYRPPPPSAAAVSAPKMIEGRMLFFAGTAMGRAEGAAGAGRTPLRCGAG